MGINFAWTNNLLKKKRMDYVKEFKIDNSIKIEPCSKFVACFEKLSKSYALALRDNSTIETLQVANQKDIEFFEGYEIANKYTDDLRRSLCNKSATVYSLINMIRSMLNKLENLVGGDSKGLLNDIKLDFSVISSVVLNIYQHLTMTNDTPSFDNYEGNSDLRELLNNLKKYIIEVVDMLIEIKSGIIIDYISRQLQIIIDKILNHYNKIINELK